MSAARPTGQPLWSFVEESLDEAGFLWTRWEAALESTDLTLADVSTWVEDRLFGALDGVRVAGDAAVEPLLVPALAERDLGRVSAAAYVLASLGSAAAHEALCNALRGADARSGPALEAALARLPSLSVLSALWQYVGASASPHGRAALLGAFASQGHVPDLDLRAYLEDPAPCVASAAARVIARAPVAQREAALGAGIASSVPEVRNQAIASGLRTGSARAWKCCQARVRALDADSGPLLLWAALLGGPEERASVRAAAKLPALARDALWALGFSGTCEDVETCLAHIREGSAHARVAGEALAAIWGLDLAARGWVVPEPAPQDEPVALEDDDLDADLVPALDAQLPRPASGLLAQWWEREQARFEPGARYLGGKRAGWETWVEALCRGPMRRRHALADALCARSAGACDLQTRAWTRVQRAQLDALARVPTVLRSRGAATLGLRERGLNGAAAS